jgi:hypothetical protein
MGSGGRTLCQLAFWLWGIAGLLDYLLGAAHHGRAMMTEPELLAWIGGMLLFGIGGLLQGSDYDFKRPVDAIHLEE